MKILKILALTLLAITVLIIMLFYEGDIPKDVVDARYSSPHSQFLELGDLGRIHFRDEGHRRSLPVLLLHGSNASLHTFEPWVDRLEDSYRLITVDLPGHGLTGEIPSSDYSLNTMTQVIDQVTEHLRIDEFVIGGNSMGGGLAWRYTLQNPERVLGLVLIDASGPMLWRDKDDSNQVWGFELLKQPWFRTIAQNMDPYHLVTQGLRSAYNHSPIVDDRLIMRYNDMLLREGTRRATVLRFAQRDRSGEDADLSKISAPTLLMWGKEDSVIPFAFASQFENSIPDVTTAYYDRLGHIPMEEDPATTSQDLAKFLEDLAKQDLTEQDLTEQDLTKEARNESPEGQPVNK